MTHPTQEDDVKALRDALAAGPDSAFYTHPRDSNKWMQNEAFSLACTPARIARLLARLEQAERDAGRYRWLRARPLSGDDAIWIGCDDVRIKGRWGLGGTENRFDPNSGPDACDREIDAAIASEAKT